MTLIAVAPCLINTYLRNCLRQGRQTRVIFDTVLLFLKHAKIVQEPRLLCLLHMLRSFITTVPTCCWRSLAQGTDDSLSIQCPNVDSDIIENIIHHVKQYYLWPWPYGNVARELLQLLTIELKSPGMDCAPFSPYRQIELISLSLNRCGHARKVYRRESRVRERVHTKRKVISPSSLAFMQMLKRLLYLSLTGSARFI